MSEINNYEKNKFGIILKNILKERSISIRKFSQITTIDASTLSRIINGKRKATPEHLKAISNALNIPISVFFEANGYEIKAIENDFNEAINKINAFLEISEEYKNPFNINELNEELDKCTEFSKTKEGKKIIKEEFEEKIEKIDCRGPFIDQLKNMFSAFLQNKSSLKSMALMGGALLYFIINVDIIPDYIFPIGYIDDAFVVEIVSNSLKNK